jgi:hypothetical protein
MNATSETHHHPRGIGVRSSLRSRGRAVTTSPCTTGHWQAFGERIASRTATGVTRAVAASRRSGTFGRSFAGSVVRQAHAVLRLNTTMG